MTIGKALIAAAVLAIAAPATAAFAHDDDYGQHARDHRAHWRFHREVNEAHRRAHEEGFYSEAEHRAYLVPCATCIGTSMRIIPARAMTTTRGTVGGEHPRSIATVDG